MNALKAVGLGIMMVGIALWIGVGEPARAGYGSGPAASETPSVSESVYSAVYAKPENGLSEIQPQAAQATLSFDKDALVLGPALPGQKVTGIIKGVINADCEWTLTVTVVDLSSPEGGRIEADRVLLFDAATPEQARSAQGGRYVCTGGRLAKGKAFEHVIQIDIPEDAEPGSYSGTVTYVLEPLEPPK